MLILLVAGAAGCGDAGPGGGGTGEAETTVALEDIHTVGGSDVIARVRDLQPLDDGSIWVLNTVEPYFVQFDPAGRPVRAWGRTGDGPLEFRRPTALVRGPAGDDVWAYDRGHNTIIQISGPEEPRVEIRLPPDSLPAGRLVSTANIGVGSEFAWIEPYGNGFVMARRSLSAIEHQVPGAYEADLIAIARTPTGNAASLTRLLTLRDIVGDPMDRYGGAAVFLPIPLWSFCPDRTLAVYDPLENVVQRVESNGIERARHALPPERRVALTDDRMFRMIYRLMLQEMPAGGRPDSVEFRRQLEAEMRAFSSEFASVFPEYNALACGSGSTVWLQFYDVDAEPTLWLRIEPDGTTRRVRFPERFTPYRFTGGRIWGVLRDEFDVATLAWTEVR